MNEPQSPSSTASARIRERINEAGRRIHANDNIAEFIGGAAELAALEDEVAGRMQALLESLVIDTEADHNTRGTARRVARMFLHEVFKGAGFERIYKAIRGEMALINKVVSKVCYWRIACFTTIQGSVPYTAISASTVNRIVPTPHLVHHV